MRIAIDARLVSYLGGGTSRYTIQLVNALATLPSGEEIMVLEGRGGAPAGTWPPSTRTHRLLTPPHHHLEQLTLPAELLLVGADLVHSPDFIPPFYRNCRSVITIHDLAFLRFPDLLTAESARYYGQVGRASRSADQVIAVSHATKQDVVELLGVDPGKVTIAYEAAGAECRPMERGEMYRQRKRLGLADRFILFVGTLEPRKNLPLLLRAFSAVWKEHRVPLVVVGGKGWLYEEVFATHESLALGDAVVFAGQVASEELVNYYNCAAALVLPSLYEGFGLPALEAMACGTPAIVSDVSSLPEITGDAALRVDPHDAEGFTAAMRAVLGDQELRETLRAKGLERASQFSWEKAARETLDVYRKAMKVRP